MAIIATSFITITTGVVAIRHTLEQPADLEGSLDSPGVRVDRGGIRMLDHAAALLRVCVGRWSTARRASANLRSAVSSYTAARPQRWCDEPLLSQARLRRVACEIDSPKLMSRCAALWRDKY